VIPAELTMRRLRLLLRVRRLEVRIANVGTARPKPTTPCLVVEGQERRLMRKVVEQLLPPRPPSTRLCHCCGDPRCYAPDHVVWGTRVDAARGSSSKGGSRVNNLQELHRRLQRLRVKLLDLEDEIRGFP
jgi:hypothetical protein